MLIILSLSEINSGNLALNINSLGAISVKKFNNNGNLIELSSGDLIKDVKYILEFNGDNFILLNQITAKEIFEKIKTLDGEGSGLNADLLDGKESTNFATAQQGLKAESAIQSVKGNGLIINPDEEKCVNITPENINAVPTTRTINNKNLSENINLSPEDIGASSLSHFHSEVNYSTSGFMSKEDKSKLDAIATGATRNVITYGTENPTGGLHGDIYFKYS